MNPDELLNDDGTFTEAFHEFLHDRIMRMDFDLTTFEAGVRAAAEQTVAARYTTIDVTATPVPDEPPQIAPGTEDGQ